MANRSYIYARGNDWSNVVGVCEAAYDIPLVFKLLVSENVQMVESQIFEGDDLVALQGDYKGGLKKLYSFLDDLSLKNVIYELDLKDKIEKTKEFFNSINSEYFYLDCCEIYAMDDEDMVTQNKRIFEEVLNIEQEIERFYVDFQNLSNKYNELKNKLPYKGLFSGRKNEAVQRELNKLKINMNELLFLDDWNKILYYDF